LFVASRDTAACVTLRGLFTPLHRQIDDFCRAVAERPGAYSLSAAEIANLQLTLGQALFGSAADLVMRADRLVIVPDHHLHALPFGLLALPNSAGEPITLLDHASVFVLPSVSVLATAPESDSTGVDAEGAFLVVSAGGEGGASLRGAQAEARALGSRYSGVVECRGPVTPEELCDRMEDSRIIHIAAHVDVNDQEPWYSGIQVGTAPAVGASTAVRAAPTTSMESMEILSAEDSLFVARTFVPDPYLRAHQVADLLLSARLAVLSGCESALGRLTVGEGVIGLGSAFMHAGVPTVIGSLWEIDDRTTVDLMKALYDGLADGLSVAQALRRAQLEMRARARTAHPYYWAGFVVVGDGRQTVPLDRKSSLVPVATIAASLLLLTAAGWFVMRTTKKRESQRPL
jgi:CHAT domain-containing protein